MESGQGGETVIKTAASIARGGKAMKKRYI